MSKVEIREKHSLPPEEVSRRILSQVPDEMRKYGLKEVQKGENWLEASGRGARARFEWDAEEVRAEIDGVPFFLKGRVRQGIEEGLRDLLSKDELR